MASLSTFRQPSHPPDYHGDHDDNDNGNDDGDDGDDDYGVVGDDGGDDNDDGDDYGDDDYEDDGYYGDDGDHDGDHDHDDEITDTIVECKSKRCRQLFPLDNLQISIFPFDNSNDNLQTDMFPVDNAQCAHCTVGSPRIQKCPVYDTGG